jgi:hypothetical protein
MENRLIDIAVFAFVLFFIVPLVISAVLYALDDRVKEWRTADRSSAGLLPPARADQGAVVRIFSARTVRWRGIIATHSWIVVKEASAPAYSRFDCTAWGGADLDRPLRAGRTVVWSHAGGDLRR